jgi:hypothetical protein
MVGLFIEDPSPEANGKAVRVTYERNETVQKTVIKEFKIDSGEVLLYTREESSGPLVPLTPAWSPKVDSSDLYRIRTRRASRSTTTREAATLRLVPIGGYSTALTPSVFFSNSLARTLAAAMTGLRVGPKGGAYARSRLTRSG